METQTTKPRLPSRNDGRYYIQQWDAGHAVIDKDRGETEPVLITDSYERACDFIEGLWGEQDAEEEPTDGP